MKSTANSPSPMFPLLLLMLVIFLSPLLYDLSRWLRWLLSGG